MVLADICFTAPMVVQFNSGLWLMHMLSLSLTQARIACALGLFVLVGVCWLPELWLQIRARNLAIAAARDGTLVPPTYFRAMRWWFWLGWPAFLSVMAIFWLMVFRPVAARPVMRWPAQVKWLSGFSCWGGLLQDARPQGEHHACT